MLYFFILWIDSRISPVHSRLSKVILEYLDCIQDPLNWFQNICGGFRIPWINSRISSLDSRPSEWIPEYLKYKQDPLNWFQNICDGFKILWIDVRISTVDSRPPEWIPEFPVDFRPFECNTWINIISFFSNTLHGGFWPC